MKDTFYILTISLFTSYYDTVLEFYKMISLVEIVKGTQDLRIFFFFVLFLIPTCESTTV